LFTPHLFPSIFTAIARPFWRLEFSIESGALKSPETLLNENEALTSQLADAQVRLDTIGAIESENSELKALLGRDTTVSATISNSSTSTLSTNSTNSKTSSKSIQRNVETRILAAVLKRPPFSPYDELIIDIGNDYKLSTSSTVYADGGVLIGRVIDVLSTTAKVKLFSSPNEKYEVLVGISHTPATAIGRGGGQYETNVSRDTVVKEGDFVFNSSLSDKPFGIVSAVLLDPTLPFETILFAPPVNVYKLKWVLVKN
jgi:cell shape-determining protein MreC